MKELMKIKTIIVFVSSFLLFLLLIQGLNHYHKHQHAQQERRQSTIILENVEDRFRLFLRSSITVGIVGAQHFSTIDLEKGNYAPFSKKLLKLHDEIIGLNLVNAEGKIVRVFPEDVNRRAIGLVSQNYEEFRNSYERGENFWFSPPFKLFQGPQGFVLYFPITTHQDKLKGWFATVLITELFVRDFKLQEFLGAYELIIKDKVTDQKYFATALEPGKEERFFERSEKILGRELVFLTWKKSPGKFIFIPWSWAILGGLFFSCLVILLLKSIEQKRKTRLQLEDISTLLKLTSKEALSKLIDLQDEIFKLGSAETIQYVTHLIEQIDLLQTTANTGKVMDLETIDLRTVLLKEIDEVQELAQKKTVAIDFASEKVVNVTIETNAWLFQNSVLNNILTHSIIHAEAGSTISIEYQYLETRNSLTIHTQQLHKLDFEDRTINLDRRMKVAKKVLTMFKGDMNVDNDLAGGMIIKIEWPIPR